MSNEQGSAGVEVGFAISALMLMLFLTVGGMRISSVNGEVNAAARAGARAASQSYDPAQGRQAANAVVADALADRGVACIDLTVTTTGNWDHGGRVSVDVACTVDLSDVVLAGFPGTRIATGTGAEVIDTIRGDQP